MTPHFTEAERAVHYPDDRRAYLGIKPYMKIILLVLIFGNLGNNNNRDILGGNIVN